MLTFHVRLSASTSCRRAAHYQLGLQPQLNLVQGTGRGVRFGRSQTILLERKWIKRSTIIQVRAESLGLNPDNPVARAFLAEKPAGSYPRLGTVTVTVGVRGGAPKLRTLGCRTVGEALLGADGVITLGALDLKCGTLVVGVLVDGLVTDLAPVMVL